MQEMRINYCGDDNTTTIEPRIESEECDINEITTAKDWM